MRCPKCGEECNSGVWFCDACGCDLRENAKKETEAKGAKMYSGEENNYFEYKDLQPQGGKKSGRPMKKHKKGEAASIVIVVTLLAIMALAGFFIYQSIHKEPYEKKLDEIAQLFNERSANIDKYGKAFLPDNIWEDFIALGEAQYEESGKNSGEMRADLTVSMKSAMDTLDGTLGSDFQIEFKVEDARKLGEDELSEIEASYMQVSQLINVFTESSDVLKDKGKVKSYEAYQKLMDDFTSIKFTEGYELEVTVIMATDGDERESVNKLRMVRADGKWMVDFMHNVNELSSMLSKYIIR